MRRFFTRDAAAVWAVGRLVPPRPRAYRLKALTAALALLALGGGVGAMGQTTGAAESALEVRAGERMSDWLLRWQSAEVPQASYVAGLMHTRPALAGPQAAERAGLLRHLEADNGQGWGPLAAWLRSQAVTGRWPLAVADARWLQANPAQDPLLQAGDRVWVPPRPVHVSTLLPDGRVCQVPHQSGAMAAQYLEVCLAAAGLPGAQHAWVVQPDGRVQRVGLAAWSAQAQAHPAPGAWLWAEVPGRRLLPADEQRLARWLATQGPGPDLPASAQAVVRAHLPATLWSQAVPPRDAITTASDWGEVGLLQTPTARMAPAGTVRFHWSRVQPYTRGTVMLQPFDWLEGGFRYTDVSNRLYGPDIAGTQSYKDKSIDFKLRLWEEGPWAPQVSVGVRDLGGTGLFSGEYLVAGKRWGDLDFSLGLGWGYLGARGDLPNPLGGRFATRAASDTPTGGTANLSSLFRGRTALFGGVQWHTPWNNLVLKAEIEGNDYRSEPQANAQKQSTPLNVGLVWRAMPGVDVTAGWERGQRAMVGLTLHSGLSQVSMPKPLDAPPPRPSPAAESATPDWGALVATVEAQVGWRVDALHEEGQRLVLHISDAFGAYKNDRIDRLIAIAHAYAPQRFQQFVLHFGQRNLDGLQVRVVDRMQWLRTQVAPAPPGQERPVITAVEPSAMPLPTRPFWKPNEARLKFGVSPTYGQILGGPDGFVLFQAGVAGDFQLQLDRTSWVTGVLHARLIDNFDKFKYTAPSDLPRVRTYQREYVTTRRVTVPYLQWTHLGRLSEDQFYMAYAGLLESMFGGAGAEWMWRPAGSRLSLSVDVNRVRQRAFEQDFSFRDYEVTTGHATVHWNTPWQGVLVGVSAGQYLAGDRGVTLDVGRTFSNGVGIGAFATKTNVSKLAFGEGSFDKGIYLSIPLDAFLAKSTNAFANVVWKPLTRDGGAKLQRSPSLYGVTQIRDSEAFRYEPARD
ncbi:MAG: YjbH domain-containing protein [Betaproteobacteria bacterium]